MACILCIAGKIAVGKTAVSNEIASKIGKEDSIVITISDYLKSLLPVSINHIDDRAILQEVGNSEISKGWDQFTASIIKFANWNSYGLLIIDGIRHIELCYAFRDTYPNHLVKIICLTAREESRIKRMETRGEKKNMLNEDHPSEGRMEPLLNNADIVIDTSDQSIEDISDLIISKLNIYTAL